MGATTLDDKRVQPIVYALCPQAIEQPAKRAAADAQDRYAEQWCLVDVCQMVQKR
jgi:hypothetical protein